MDVETPLHPSARRRGVYIRFQGGDYVVPKAFMDEIRVSFADLGNQSVFARLAILDISLALNVPQPLIGLSGV